MIHWLKRRQLWPSNIIGTSDIVTVVFGFITSIKMAFDCIEHLLFFSTLKCCSPYSECKIKKINLIKTGSKVQVVFIMYDWQKFFFLNVVILNNAIFYALAMWQMFMLELPKDFYSSSVLEALTSGSSLVTYIT